MRTFGDLVERYRLPHVNLLVIDTEGYDRIVFESALAAGLLPDIVNIEVVNLDHKDYLGVKRLLIKHGHAFADCGDDIVTARLPLYAECAATDYNILKRSSISDT